MLTRALGFIGLTLCVLVMAADKVVAQYPQAALALPLVSQKLVIIGVMALPLVLFLVALFQGFRPSTGTWTLLGIYLVLGGLALSGHITFSGVGVDNPYVIPCAGFAAVLFMSGVIEDEPERAAAAGPGGPGMPGAAAPQRNGGARAR